MPSKRLGSDSEPTTVDTRKCGSCDPDTGAVCSMPLMHNGSHIQYEGWVKFWPGLPKKRNQE